jgi:hypothetical protein
VVDRGVVVAGQAGPRAAGVCPKTVVAEIVTAGAYGKESS